MTLKLSRPSFVLAFGVSIAALMLSACGGGGGGASGAGSGQVAVKVNEAEISVHQIDALLKRQGGAATNEAAGRQTLEALVDQELAAQAAVKAGLDRDPDVVQQLALVRRETLARAWQERLLQDAAQPSTDEVVAYRNGHPELFSERKLYTITELTVAGQPDQLTALRSRLSGARGAEQTLELVRVSGLQQGPSMTVSRAAEDIPLVMLRELHKRKVGESLWVPGPGAARLMIITDARLAPMDDRQALRVVQSFLHNERKRTLMREGVQRLRGEAAIAYQGRFAASAPAPAASRP
jgi:EpsD family peptidyl-prolyl cis-trans isomerase